MDRFLASDEVEAFWDGARGRAAADQQTGYLTDAWPREVGARRFAGELAAVDRMLARHRVRRGRCLDVGCGTGVWLEALARRFERAEGIDLSAAMVASAAAYLAARGVTNASVTRTGVGELAADAAYDLIFVGGVLMYVDDADVAAVIARLRACLAPGGVMILRESTYVGRTWYRDRPMSRGLLPAGAVQPPYRAIYRPLGWYRAALAGAGFEVVATRVNTSYLLAEVTEAELLALDRLSRGALRRDRARAEAAARWLHRLRPLTLWPALLARPLLRFAWRLANHWIVCR